MLCAEFLVLEFMEFNVALDLVFLVTCLQSYYTGISCLYNKCASALRAYIIFHYWILHNTPSSSIY